MASAVLSESKPSVYESVTAQIIAAIEAGAGTCVMPWHAGIVPMTMPKERRNRTCRITA
ncbi:MAG: ArdC family protein [Rhizomicrobium sp.]